MARILRVVHYGLGPIGQGIARLALQTDGLKVVGATDIAPEKAGKDLGTLLDCRRSSGSRSSGTRRSFSARSGQTSRSCPPLLP
jgi:hypothetical protein